ncbi:unnamed protein product [Bursaphelenchus xylophilus]|uniref:glutathione transferase n=1 Tax=Bursaphelenchus xylophilus TaxID=6326 RepID=A0A1I7SHG8_BURXY|nr:unnamed protein product [Bursaphelenchus xylophilus]CAG9104727.1 unnamed protein product [Bursaphelenchus xylophilus]
MPEYELLYFAAPGRAETIRLMLHYAGIPFKDTRVDFKEWSELKKNKERVPYEVLPVLFVDGVPLAESHAIYRYVAEITGLDGGPDPLERAFISQAHELCRGFADAAFPYIYVMMGFWDDDKDKSYNEVLLPNVEKHFPKILAQLKPSGYFGKAGPTFVDFYWAEIIGQYRQFCPELMAKYPQFEKLRERINSLPQIQEYLKNRPETKTWMRSEKSPSV